MDKIQHPFLIQKTLQKVGIAGTYLNIIKATWDKPTAPIILSGEKPKEFPLRSGTGQGCALSPLLFNVVSEVLATAVRAEKGTQGVLIRKEEVELPLFADDKTLNLENPEDAPRKLFELIRELGKVAGYKINTQKSTAFLCSNNERLEREIRGTVPFTIATKRIKYLGINPPKETKEEFVAQWLTNPTRNHEVAGSIPGLAPWVKDLALP